MIMATNSELRRMKSAIWVDDLPKKSATPTTKGPGELNTTEVISVRSPDFDFDIYTPHKQINGINTAAAENGQVMVSIPPLV